MHQRNECYIHLSVRKLNDLMRLEKGANVGSFFCLENIKIVATEDKR